MRIAMLGPFGLGPKGTMSRRAVPLAREAAAFGHAVLVVMPPWHTSEPPRRWQQDGVALEYVGLARRAGPFAHAIITLWLLRRILAWRPDVVHCFKAKAHAGWAAWVLWHMRRLGIVHARLVVDEDDWEGAGGWNDVEPYGPLARRMFSWQERWGIGHCDLVTVASRTLQSIVWSLGVTPDRVLYLPNGAPPAYTGDSRATRAALGLGDGLVVLLYTRFLEFDPERAVLAFARVRKSQPNARLLVVGQALRPEDEACFRSAVLRHGLAPWVIEVGWVPAARLGDYMGASDVGMCPFDDTLINRCKCSVKLTELLSSGLPVVADAVGQSAEYIVSGQTGLLVTAGDTHAMAGAIARLLCDPDLRGNLSRGARRRMAEEYAWPSLAQVLLKAYGSSSPYSVGSSVSAAESGSGSRSSR